MRKSIYSLVLCIFVMFGCADAKFQSGQSSKDGPESSPGEVSTETKSVPSEDLKKENFPSAETIAAQGKSLDLFFVIDHSGSLGQNDPDCSRFEAISEFRKRLVSHLGDAGDARASFILFSDVAKFHATIDDFLRMTTEEFKSTFRSHICQNEGSTNPSAAFEITMSKAEELRVDKPKDMSSVLFFTDGLPNLDTKVLDKKINAMKSIFEGNIFSVLLWPNDAGISADQIKANEIQAILNGSIENIGSEELLGIDSKGIPTFIRNLSGKDSRIKRVGEASDLGTAIIDFIR